MAVDIRTPPVGRFIQELASRTGEEPSEVLSTVVRERRARLRGQRFDAIEARLQELQPLFSKIPASWEIDELLYDEGGMPK